MFGYNPENCTHTLKLVLPPEKLLNGDEWCGEKEMFLLYRLPLAYVVGEIQNTHELKHKQPYGNKQLEKTGIN